MSSNTQSNKPSHKGFMFVAGICAVGFGLLAAATVLSTPASLILFLGSAFVVNYTLPSIYRWLSRRWVQQDLDNKRIAHDQYITELLNSEYTQLDMLDKQHARNLSLTRSFWTSILSLVISGALGIAVYFLLSFVPVSILTPIVSVLMFGALAVITYMNFYGGMKDVWEGLKKRFSATENKGDSLHPLVKWVLIPVFTLSCIAAGVLIGSMTFEGVETTLLSFVMSGVSLASFATPLAWISFGCVSMAWFAMAAYGIFDWLDKDKRAAKMDMMNSLFKSTEAYKKDLEGQWKDVQSKISDKKAEYRNAQTEDVKSDLSDELNELYAKKDSIYHRYSVYQQPWFNTLYKAITFVVMAASLAGMLLHIARGYQGLDGMFTKAMGLSHALARGVATSVMYVSMLAETFFTATVVTSTMDEEAILGKQSRQYEDHLVKQQTLAEKGEEYLFQTSRGMHFLFEGLLGLFGADGHEGGHGHGHGGSGSMPYGNNANTRIPMSIGMAGAAGLEKCELQHELVTFRYDASGQVYSIHTPQERAEYFQTRANRSKISS